MSQGCGYQLVRAGSDAPTSKICFGRIIDLTAEGDLGQLVSSRIKSQFGAQLMDEVVCSGQAVLEGRIRMRSPTGAIAFDSNRKISGHYQRMELELTVRGTDGEVDWTSGFVEGRAIWLRGATVLDTREAQRRGRRMILDELVDDVLQRFLSFETMKEMP